MIDLYEFGRIVIDGRQYQKDVFVGPDKVSDWKRVSGHAVYEDDVRQVIGEQPEIIIIGNGADSIMQVGQEVHDFFADKKIPLIVKDSAAACEEYNRLKKEGKRVAALIHLTC
ncbi:MAG: Mth938-like domain-containing protein [Patescibacteria group bacterium]